MFIFKVFFCWDFYFCLLIKNIYFFHSLDIFSVSSLHRFTIADLKCLPIKPRYLSYFLFVVGIFHDNESYFSSCFWLYNDDLWLWYILTSLIQKNISLCCTKFLSINQLIKTHAVTTSPCSTGFAVRKSWWLYLGKQVRQCMRCLKKLKLYRRNQ